MRGRMILVAAVLLLLAPLAAGFGPPRQPPRQAERPIRLSLNAGYDGLFREGHWVPLLVSISNDGPDVRGHLRVRSETSPGLNATTYSTPIDLPSQSRKQVFLYISLQSFTRQVLVELATDEQNIEVVAGQLSLARSGDLLTAVVTDSPGGSLDLSGVRLGSGQSYQAAWSVENIPPLADALLGLDVIVFSDVDTGRLSVEQQQALHDWVLAGGHLIVTGGPNYRATVAGLEPLLPVEVTGTTTVDDLTALADYAGRYADRLTAPDVVLASGELRPGATALVEVDGAPLLARRAHGEGLVDYLAADPNLAPLRGWGDSEALWTVVIATARQRPSWSNGFQDWALAEQVVQQAPGFDLPSAAQMCGLLALYIVVIGPVNYAVLRVLRRRELAWLTIPGLVVAFSVLAYFTGFSLRGTQATVNRLSLVQVWPGAERAQVDGLIGILSPRRISYNVIMDEGLTLRTIPDEQAGTAGLGTVLSSTQIEQGTAYAARDVLVDASFVAGFAVSGFVGDAPQIEASATLAYGPGPAARLSGLVRNTTDFPLRDAVVLARGGSQHLGTLEPGAEARFDLPIAAVQSAPLSLATTRDLPSSYFSSYGYGYPGLQLTVQDVLGARYYANNYPYFYGYGGANSLEERARYQQQNFLTAIATDQDLSGGRGDRAFLVGWADHSPLGLALEGAGWVPEDLTLYVFEIPLAVAEPDGAVEVSPGFSTWVVAEETTVLGVTPYSLNIGGGDRAVFRFTPLPTAQLAEVSSLDVTARPNGAMIGTVALWDWQDEDWVEVDMRLSTRVTVEEAARFVGPANAVRVMVAPPAGSGTFVNYQQVDVTWRGRF